MPLAFHPVWLLAALLPVSVFGAGIQRNSAGGRSLGTAGATTVTDSAPLPAASTNPGALGFLEKPTAALNLGAGFLRGTHTDRGGNTAHLSDNGFVPDAAVAFPFGNNVVLAIGAGFDSGLRADWRYRDLPGGLDGGTSYGVRQHLSEIEVGRINGQIAWRITPQLSLGGGVNVMWNRNRLNGPYVFQTQPALRTAKVLLDMETVGWGVGGQFGLLWQPDTRVRVGLAYRTATRVETHGRAYANASTQLQRIGLGAADPTAAYDAEVTNIFPQTLELGVSWQATEHLTLSASVEWANYRSAFDTLVVSLTDGDNADFNGLASGNRLQDNIPLRWRDTWSVKIGAEYALNDEWTLRAGYAWTQSPVSQETLTPLTAVLPEHAVGAGVGWKSGAWSVDLGWMWQLPRSSEVNETVLSTEQYVGSETRVGVHWISLTTERKF